VKPPRKSVFVLFTYANWKKGKSKSEYRSNNKADYVLHLDKEEATLLFDLHAKANGIVCQDLLQYPNRSVDCERQNGHRKRLAGVYRQAEIKQCGIELSHYLLVK